MPATRAIGIGAAIIATIEQVVNRNGPA